jgi:hypothetical protein
MTARATFDGATLAVIMARLDDSDHASAEGISVVSPSPILNLCRQLVARGYDPDLPLIAVRGQTVCLRVRSIGEAARLEVNHRGTGFVARCEGRSSPPMRQPGRAGVQPPGKGCAMTRERLANRRMSAVFDLESMGMRFTASISCYDDGRLGELFLDNHKAGSAVGTLVRDLAIVFSFAVQHGADVEAIRRALCRDSQGHALSPLAAALGSTPDQ